MMSWYLRRRSATIRQRAAFAFRPRAQERRYRLAAALDAGNGHTPAKLYKAQLGASACGLCPATISVSAAACGPVPSVSGERG